MNKYKVYVESYHAYSNSLQSIVSSRPCKIFTFNILQQVNLQSHNSNINGKYIFFQIPEFCVVIFYLPPLQTLICSNQYFSLEVIFDRLLRILFKNCTSTIPCGFGNMTSKALIFIRHKLYYLNLLTLKSIDNKNLNPCAITKATRYKS